MSTTWRQSAASADLALHAGPVLANQPGLCDQGPTAVAPASWALEPPGICRHDWVTRRLGCSGLTCLAAFPSHSPPSRLGPGKRVVLGGFSSPHPMILRTSIFPTALLCACLAPAASAQCELDKVTDNAPAPMQGFGAALALHADHAVIGVTEDESQCVGCDTGAIA